jgi:hypothetical protein
MEVVTSVDSFPVFFKNTVRFLPSLGTVCINICGKVLFRLFFLRVVLPLILEVKVPFSEQLHTEAVLLSFVCRIIALVSDGSISEIKILCCKQSSP